MECPRHVAVGEGGGEGGWWRVCVCVGERRKREVDESCGPFGMRCALTKGRASVHLSRQDSRVCWMLCRECRWQEDEKRMCEVTVVCKNTGRKWNWQSATQDMVRIAKESCEIGGVGKRIRLFRTPNSSAARCHNQSELVMSLVIQSTGAVYLFLCALSCDRKVETAEKKHHNRADASAGAASQPPARRP